MTHSHLTGNGCSYSDRQGWAAPLHGHLQALILSLPHLCLEHSCLLLPHPRPIRACSAFQGGCHLGQRVCGSFSLPPLGWASVLRGSSLPTAHASVSESCRCCVLVRLPGFWAPWDPQCPAVWHSINLLHEWAVYPPLTCISLIFWTLWNAVSSLSCVSSNFWLLREQVPG